MFYIIYLIYTIYNNIFNIYIKLISISCITHGTFFSIYMLDYIFSLDYMLTIIYIQHMTIYSHIIDTIVSNDYINYIIGRRY